VIRGTLRNQGWCEKIKKLVDLGYVEETPLEAGLSYAALTAKLIGKTASKDLSSQVAGERNVLRSNAEISLQRFFTFRTTRTSSRRLSGWASLIPRQLFRPTLPPCWTPSRSACAAKWCECVFCRFLVCSINSTARRCSRTSAI
jgi:hypothetical protein